MHRTVVLTQNSQAKKIRLRDPNYCCAHHHGIEGPFERLRADLILRSQNLSAPFLTVPNKRSSIIFSTTVPLTLAFQKSNLHGIEHRSTHQGRRKSIETMGWGGVYRFRTGPLPELLDIGVARYRLPPGLFLTSEAQCHANSRLYSLP